jgi:Secretion system C-terminal sorting domain
MRNIIIILLVLIMCPHICLSQLRFDNTWIIGYGDSIPEYHEGGVKINFINGSFHQTYFDINLFIENNVSMSDSIGNLLFYVNGCSIANNTHKIMLNGDDINPGIWHNQECEYGNRIHQASLILPITLKKNKYYLFHMNRPDPDKYIKQLMYSVIDMELDGGLGGVVEKNVLIRQDTFAASMMTAVRHGNGQDWWLVVPQYNTAKYLTYLISNQGISSPIEQVIGVKLSGKSRGTQAVFSPNGKYYANFSPLKVGLQIFDFDRCSGNFENPRHFDFSNEMVSACGVSFSPDSRFLYASTPTSLYQYDMLARDFERSKKLIDTFVWFDSTTLQERFYMMRLAPDGKIYMGTTNSTRYFHVINEPNKLGKDCNFKQHGIELLVKNSFTVPNFPYYNLFDAEGSPCDTLGITVPPPYSATIPKPPNCLADALLYPNPTSNTITIKLSDCAGGVGHLFSMQGQWLQDINLPSGEEGGVLDLSSQPTGIYILSIVNAEGEKVSKRVSVVR